MTVGTTDPFAVHLALSEGAEDIDFFVDLAIRMIEVILQQREGVVIVEPVEGSMTG